MNFNGVTGRSLKREFRVPKMKHLWITIHPEHHAQVVQRAVEQDISISEWIRRAIVHELNDTRLRRIKACIERNGKHETGDC